jgi:E3 SUMO-protein ligase NSE2
MRQLIDTENQLMTHEETLRELSQKVTRGEAVVSLFFYRHLSEVAYCIQPEIIARYEEGMERRNEEYSDKTSRQKYAKHEEYVSFRQAVYVCFCLATYYFS